MIPHAIIEDLCAERLRQAQKFPADEIADMDVFLMLAVLGEEVGEAAQAALDIRHAAMNGVAPATLVDMGCKLRAELVQIAAVAVKMIAKFDDDTLIIDLPATRAPAGPDAEGNAS